MKKEFDTLDDLLRRMSLCPVCNSKRVVLTGLTLITGYRGYDCIVDSDTNSLKLIIDVVSLPKAIVTIHSDNLVTVGGQDSISTIRRARETQSKIFIGLYSMCPNKCSSINSMDIEIDLENYTASPFSIAQETIILKDNGIIYDIDSYYDEAEPIMYISSEEMQDSRLRLTRPITQSISMDPVEFDFSDRQETINRIQNYLLFG